MLRRKCRAALVIAAALSTRAASAQNPTFSTVGTGYASIDTNSCAVGINNLTTSGSYQFIAYYGPVSGSVAPLMIGRRDLGSSTWSTFNSGLTVTSSEISDDHNIVAIAVDSSGYMHTSYNMHNQALKYAISTTPLTTPTLSSVAFQDTSWVPPAGATNNSVTYPQFYNIPGSNNLLFTYRNGGAGGGSGNGNQYFNVYNPSTHAWTSNLAIDGEATSVNGYINSLARKSNGDIMMSWTWRASPAWQSNSSIMFAQSPDNGTSWQRQDGSPYTGPIQQTGPNAGQVIKTIPQNNSLINQTSMTVDNEDRPLIATWYAPAEGSGNHNRQYALVHYDGTQWKTSLITSRTTDNAIDTSAFAVRDLGRPIVLVDNSDRVLVVTRSTDTYMGAYDDPAVTDNEIVVYYNTVASLNSSQPVPWQSVALDTANMGAWEPTYDANLWAAQKKLSLFYEPVNLGAATGTVKVLDWDPVAYFASLNTWNIPSGGNWGTASNWSGGVPNAASAMANFGGGVAPTADCTVTVDGAKTLGSITFFNPYYRYTLVSGASGSLTMNNGASASTITASSGNHTIALPVNVGASGVNVAVTDTLTISGNMTGSGGVAKNSGSGTLVLSGTNSYTGQTSVTAGTLRIASATALSSSNLLLSGGVLESSVNFSRARGTGANQIQITGGNSGFAAHGTNVSFAITGTVSWGSGMNPGFNPGVFVINNPTSSGNVTLTNGFSLNGGARNVLVNAGVNTFSGAITSNTGSLLVSGNGTLVLTGNNTYGGGTIISPSIAGPGAVRAASNTALGAGGVDIGPIGNGTTARLESAGNITVPNALTFRGRTNNSVGIENISGNNTFSGPVTLQVGGSVYWLQSDAGTLTLSGTLTSAATGARLLSLMGDGNGVISGPIQNGSATVSITKSGNGTWTLSGANTYSGSTSATGGTLALASTLTSSNSVSATAATIELTPSSDGNRVLRTPSLGATLGGKIDLQNNKAIVPAGSLSALTTLVASGRNNGAWDGPGIMTSRADADSLTTGIAIALNSALPAPKSTFGEVASVVSNDVLLMYTYVGDRNLDADIDGDDYAAIDAGFASHGGLSGYINGDFNYSGNVDADDYWLIDRNYVKQHTVDLAPGLPVGGLTAVPEPSTWGMLTALTALGMRRRRGRQGE